MHLQGYIDNKKYELKTMHLADVLAGTASPLSPGGGT
jgi:hypothetical protein